MTGGLTLPGSPSSINQAATKGYVDGKVAAGLPAAVAGATWAGGSSALIGSPPGAGSSVKIEAGYNAGTTDGNGDLQIPFPQNFSNLISIVAIPTGSGAGILQQDCKLFSYDTTQFFLRFVQSYSGLSMQYSSVACTWIAIGN